MSKAGIQSNRGDGYQTLVAFDCALTVLSDPAYEWLEIDSVTVQVDDVVIGKADGSKIGCQCKKNQTGHKAWSVADLGGELKKAYEFMASDAKASVRFYSRNPFGELGALRELSSNYADKSSYEANLGKALGTTDSALKAQFSSNATLSTYDFLHRATFEVSPELERMEELLRERLRRLVSNSNAVFNALWTNLDQLGARINSNNNQNVAIQHRLTKQDIKNILAQAGAMLTPPMDKAEVLAAFNSTSAIGRTWRRDIEGQRIASPVVGKLMDAIECKHRSILLTGQPGAGKTCVMLDLQDKLEQLAKSRSDLCPLFIQSRDFADLTSAQDRQAHGLPERWVEKAARMADDAHVVVVIDSLDVLSIAREHSVLTYFLAQIDRLLQIPNITVVTACRDFDRQYDRRIAARTWGQEFTCEPLTWDTDIAPLLIRLNIDSTRMDTITRELIRNPRELALFVELAQQSGSFNIVTSQALAQRYLHTIVQTNNALGDIAMQAIETIATKMLTLRSISIPRQRFLASESILRALLSHNVLHESSNGQSLTFGHQTLLDVLVINGAMRQGKTLKTFIDGLPPVPFIRPSIRSFVVQLETGERKEFRKQLRSILTGTYPFHIRRLVAECFAEQIPQNEDWSLIRDLRHEHRDVFQVIYMQAKRVEWHYFWLQHLVPILINEQDADGLATHINRAPHWLPNDPSGVLQFLLNALQLEWFDKTQSAYWLAEKITHIQTNNSKLLELLNYLLLILIKIPQGKNNFIGQAVAHGVTLGYADDFILWKYITKDICDEDLYESPYSFGEKIYCHSHDFDSKKDTFLADRMQNSVILLNLAIETIENWSGIKRLVFGENIKTYRFRSFLEDSSWRFKHSQIRHHSHHGLNVLLNAVEKAVIHHAKNHSNWWQDNRERLCFSKEGSLRYFAILACTEYPIKNLECIGKMVSDTVFLESDLSFELGTLIKTGFVSFDEITQDAVLNAMMNIYANDSDKQWKLRQCAELITTVPLHLRSPTAQDLVDTYLHTYGVLERKPFIGISSYVVSSPFSFEVFLSANDSAVLCLLEHYVNYNPHESVGGEEQVGQQLREAASRRPTRFIGLLSKHWSNIPLVFCNEIIEGVATYLSYKYGNLQISGTWEPLENPNSETLAAQILDELERHTTHWHHSRAASSALQSCAHVVKNNYDAQRLVFLCIGFESLEEEQQNLLDLITNGINMISGKIAESLMILANNFIEIGIKLPDILSSCLRRWAESKHSAVRALILRRLPYLQSHNPELGWDLFSIAIRNNTSELWTIAEPCLYYTYHQQFEKVKPWLDYIYKKNDNAGFKVWGFISALAALSNKIDFQSFLSELEKRDSTEAWKGASQIFSYHENVRKYQKECFAVLETGIKNSKHQNSVANELAEIFRETAQPISIPIELIRYCFAFSEAEEPREKVDFYGFEKWLNAISQHDARLALDAVEIFLKYARHTKHFIRDTGENLTQLLTRLFEEAEEREESDEGKMLQRVVAVQDTLLALNVDGMNEWLEASERP